MKKSNSTLYDDSHTSTSMKGTGFKNRQKALDTLHLIKNRDKTYQKLVVITMYNRAKYHPYQTPQMRDAMKIYKEWLKKYN